MKGHLAFLALLFAILPAGPVLADPAPQPVLSQLAVAARDAARKTFETIWTNFREGRAPDENLYRWSLRWLDAERQLSDKHDDQVAAFKAHWERMWELEKIIRNVRRSGQATIDEVSATEFYRVEAEIWLLQAQEEMKKP